MRKRTEVPRGNTVTKKKKNYSGEIAKYEVFGNQNLYFSEVIISMLNIAPK